MFKFALSPIKPVRAYFTLAIAAMVLGFFAWKPIYRDVSNEAVLLYCSKFAAYPHRSEPIYSSFAWLNEAFYDLKSGRGGNKSAKLQKLLGIKQDKLLIDAYLNYPHDYADFSNQTLVQIDSTMLDLSRPNMPEMKVVFQFSFKRNGRYYEMEDVEIMTLGECNKLNYFASRLSGTGPSDVVARNKKTMKYVRYANAWTEINKARSHEEFARAIESNPECSYLYYFDGTSYLIEGNYSSAVARFNKCFQLDPQNSFALVNRAIAKSALKDFAGSVFDTNVAVKMNPGNAFAHMNQGFDHCTYSNYSESIRSYNKAIQLNPLIYDNYINRALAREGLGEHTKAMIDYETAIKLYPSRFTAYMQRGALLMIMKKYKEAHGDFNLALRFCPQDYEHQNSLRYIKNSLSFINSDLY